MSKLFDAPVDLFGAAPATIPGLGSKPDLVSPAEEAGLINCINRADLSPFRFQGWLGKRLTASYGIGYDFDASRLEVADPIPAWLDPLRADAAGFAGLNPEDLTQVLLTRYDPGAGIGWHRDRPVYEHVVGVSLGASATMRFRKKAPTGFTRLNVLLPSRSIYHLKGEARYAWEHSIAETKETRWSVTFRSLSAVGVKAPPRRTRGPVREGGD